MLRIPLLPLAMHGLPLLLATVVGIFIGLLPNAFEYFLLLKEPSRQRLRHPLVRLLSKLNMLMIGRFAVAIKERMEQDNLDLQEGRHPALPNVTGKEIGRSIRKLYALHMEAIATKRRDPELLRRDLGVVPWGNFYLLVEHLGRKRFLESIKNDSPPPPPLRNWDGGERRRQRGTREDRRCTDPNDPTSSYSRCYDDQAFCDRISALRLELPKASIFNIFLLLLTLAVIDLFHLLAHSTLSRPRFERYSFLAEPIDILFVLMLLAWVFVVVRFFLMRMWAQKTIEIIRREKSLIDEVGEEISNRIEQLQSKSA